MHGHEADIEATLRQAAALPSHEHLAAAWSGYLIEFRPGHPTIEAPARPVAVLSVTDAALYLVSDNGVLRVAFDQLRGPHSPYRDVLRFSVSDGHVETAVVTMAVRGANAIAQQLNDTLQSPRLVTPPPRPRAKRRPQADYVD